MENEKRAYIRGNCFCEAEIILDEENDDTEEVSVIDLAAGGLKFTADKENTPYALGDTYTLRLSINESDITFDEILTDIKICRTELSGGGMRIYGAAFVELTEKQSVRIDEIIQQKMRRAM